MNLQASIQNFIHCPYVLHVFFVNNTYFFNFFFLECLLLNLHSFSGTFQLSHTSGRWFLLQLNNSIRCRLQNSPYIPVVKYPYFAMWRVRLTRFTRVRLTLRGRFETRKSDFEKKNNRLLFSLILFSSKRNVNNNVNLGGASFTSQFSVVLPMVKNFESILLFPRPACNLSFK